MANIKTIEEDMSIKIRYFLHFRVDFPGKMGDFSKNQNLRGIFKHVER
jgi:hypothetical protein